MRRKLFVAIPLPQRLKAEIHEKVSDLAFIYRSIAWEKEENYHITLKFLGSTSLLPSRIAWVLQKKLVGLETFSLQLGEVGIFVHSRETIFIDVVKTEPLLRLYHVINNSLESLGFVRERSVFHPHVTIGRIKQKEKDTLAINDVNSAFPGMRVGHIVLFQSIVSPAGSIYKPLQLVPFKG